MKVKVPAVEYKIEPDGDAVVTENTSEIVSMETVQFTVVDKDELDVILAATFKVPVADVVTYLSVEKEPLSAVAPASTVPPPPPLTYTE